MRRACDPAIFWGTLLWLNRGASVTQQDDATLVRQSIAACNWPDAYYGVVRYLANQMKAKTVAEIGVAYGYHAENILDTSDFIYYDGIDPYQVGYDPSDIFVSDVAKLFGEADPQRAMDRLYAAVKANLAKYHQRAYLRRSSSLDAAKEFPDGFFDLVFIDGNHTQVAVKADLLAWWPKVRPEGLFCGDDYLWPGLKKCSMTSRLRSRSSSNSL